MKMQASKSKIAYPTKESFKKLAAVSTVAAVFSGCGASVEVPIKKPIPESNKSVAVEQNVTQEDPYPDVTGGIPPLPSEQKE